MRNDKYFVTGATGFLGSHIARYLLEGANSVVCLVRGRSETEAMERLLNVLRKIPSSRSMSEGSLRVVCGNISEHSLGIKDASRLTGIKYFIHAAASVDFSSARAHKTLKANVCGSMEAIRFARALSVPFFFHVSTAYVSGKREGVIMETIDEGEREFNNAYEKSKAMAEVLLARYAKAHRMNLTILRPSIIVGDSVYGYIPKFSTIYNFLVPLARIRHNVDKGRPMKGYLKAARNGSVHVPVIIPGREETRLNLVPVDFVVRALCDMAAQSREGLNIYHLVDNDPAGMREVVRYVSDTLNMSGIGLSSPECYVKADKRGLDGALVQLNKTYMCYTTSASSYDSTEMYRVIQDKFPFPDKRKLLARMIEYTMQRVTHDTAAKITAGHEDITGYFEVFLKNKVGQRLIKNLNDITACFEIAFSDVPLKQWTIMVEKGTLASVSSNGDGGKPACTYVVSSPAFRSIARGCLSPQECFFRGEADVRGDIKQGLKLAALMEIFFKEHPYTNNEKEPSLNETAELRA